MSDASARAIGMAQIGMLANAALAAIKLAAGVAGHSYALVADAIESTFDVFGSFVVWSGLRISAQPADENHPYGHG
ncbi:MAG: cation transporter, partial [Gemmatimonadaceae bacterium]